MIEVSLIVDLLKALILLVLIYYMNDILMQTGAEYDRPSLAVISAILYFPLKALIRLVIMIEIVLLILYAIF